MKNNWYQRAMQGLNAQNNRRFSYLHGEQHANQVGILEGPRKIFSLIATSTTDAASTAQFFGLARNGPETNAGSGSGVAITGGGSVAHTEMKYLTSFEPYELQQLTLWVNAAATMPSTLTISARKAGGGELREYEITPPAYLGPDTDDATRVVLDVSGIVIDASFRVTFSLAANGTLRAYFAARKVLRIDRAFKGQDVVESNNEPIPQGSAPQRIIVESAGYNKAVR